MFQLEEITTSDGLIHQGIVSYPKGESKRAVVWIHGLTSTFYGNINLINFLTTSFISQNIAFASFNTRGHDMITGIRKVDPKESDGYSHVIAGAGYEVFEESTKDIDAVITFLTAKGYTDIFLLGHSTGANKVSYYAGTVQQKYLVGVILACPMSDRLIANKQEVETNLRKCSALVENGRENALVTDLLFFPMTAKRYISLIAPHTHEDQFGYGDTPPIMKDYKNITIPLLTIFAEKDEYADRSVQEIQKIFDISNQSSHYHSVIIKNVFHNLAGNEQYFFEEIIAWMKKIA